LFGIRSDYLEIGSAAEGQQGVVRTAADVLTARGGTNAQTLLDQGDRFVEVGSGEDEMVYHA
jgi:hypothetical protein